MGKITKLAWRNMWRNWRRTAIASVAIILGLILLIFMDALIKGSDQAIFGNAVRLYGGNIQIHASGFRDKAGRLPLIPLNDTQTVVDTISLEAEVVAATKRINTGGLVSSGAGTFPVIITAIEPEKEAPISLIAENMGHGRFLSGEDRDGVIIGRGLADLLEVEVGDRVLVVGRRLNQSMRQHPMNVIGIYDLGLDEAERGTVFINLSLAQTLYNLRDQETEIAISLAEVGQEDQLVENLQQQLPGYEVDTWSTLRPEIQQTLQTKSIATSILGLIVVLIASIGILNLMLMAVFERTREMGVLAAMGMKGRQIMALFLLEGSFIGLFGAIIGGILGWLLVEAVGQVGIDMGYAQNMGDITALMGSRLYPYLPIGDVIGYGILVIIISALASLYPAWQASRKEPAEALHHI